MNKKIILIENRPDRQLGYLPNGQNDVDELNSMSEFLDCESIENYLDKINNDDLVFLKEYELIIIHRSVLGELSNGSAVNRVITFCKDSKKDLILFSGGISNSMYTEEGGNIFLINSKEFYSNNLISFLKDYHKGKINKLLELKYGPNWKLTYLLQLREYLVLRENLESNKEKEDYYKSIEILKELLEIDDVQNIDNEINKLLESL